MRRRKIKTKENDQPLTFHAKEMEAGYWFTTETGAHVFVKEGQSKEDAIKERFGGGGGEEIGDRLDPRPRIDSKLTDSKKFKDWFGDSKVVDSAGKPQVMYHGTKEQFDIEKATPGKSWFTTDYEYAKQNAGVGKDSRVFAVYLSIKNPVPLGYALTKEEIISAGYDGAEIEPGVWATFKSGQIRNAEKRTTKLTKNAFIGNVEKQAWRFNTDSQKIAAYHKWLQQQVNAGILTTDAKGKPWTGEYVESAYKKGAMRAYTDLNAEALAQSPEFYLGGKASFLKSAFAAPEALRKIELVSTRAFEELKGVTAVMSQQLSRALADGLAHGKGPAEIARNMRLSIGSITRQRAMVIARTEIINAHAEGQLDAFEKLGIEEVDVMAEWSTSGDGLVCDECAAMEGNIIPIEEARGKIPLHPNCRCSWLPVSRKEK